MTVTSEGSMEGALAITDPAAISEVVRACVRAKPVLEITLAGHVEWVHTVRAPTSCAIAFQSDLAEGEGRVSFQVYGVMFVLTAHIKQEGDVRVCTPSQLFCLERRSAARQILWPGQAELEWVDSEFEVRRSAVRDFTPTSVRVGSFREFPAVPFAATLRIGQLVSPCMAELQRTDGETAGLSLQPAQHVSILESYLQERHPQLSARQGAEPEELQTLMEASGYLDLRSHAGSFKAWHSNGPKDALGVDMVYRAADGKLLGHVSATQAYRKTWVWHQLACLSGHAESGECRLTLYAMGASIPRLYQGQDVNAIAYFNPEKRWHKLFFHGFLTWLNDPALATICYFDRFERDLPCADFDAPDCEVRLAVGERELMLATALVRSCLPETTANALDIHPGELRSPAACGERGREVLVLYERGALVGVCLCELGDPNLSLFNIFNIAQIYTRQGNSPSVAAQRMLAAKARALYAARGVASPLVTSPAGSLDREFEPGTQWVESMGCMVITGAALRHFEDFCRFHFGRRWRRNENGVKNE